MTDIFATVGAIVYMTTITLNSREYTFVPVPDDANNLHIEENTLYYSDKIFKDAGGGYETLPDGNYKFIATTTDITEEQAGEIGIKDLTKDGKTFKFGLVASDGLPASSSDKTGWKWSDFKNTLPEAVDTLLAYIGITGRHAIIEQL